MILFINIIGFAIGTLQHGLDASQAAENYVLLTIGDGLVAQMPSMLLSTATAIIVTRVSGEQDMSAEVSVSLPATPVFCICRWNYRSDGRGRDTKFGVFIDCYSSGV